MASERGWMPGVRRIETSHFGYTDLPRGGMRPIAVVNHVAQGYVRTLDDWARRGVNVSPHFGITRAGEVHQYVGIFDAGYHAGRLDPGHPPTWRRYRQGVNPNRYTIGIEFEGFSAVPTYGYDYVYEQARPWPEPMVEAGIDVHRWIFRQIDIEPSSDSVIGHSEIAPLSRANDPGPCWPRARILEALGAGAARSPELSLAEALALVVEAYRPQGAAPRARLLPRPIEGEQHVYRMEVDAPGS